MQKGFYLDLTRCTSCYACVVACKAHHAIQEETVYWRRVLTLEGGTYPNVRVANVSLSCLHCAIPACKVVCPTRAIYKRREDGLVLDAEIRFLLGPIKEGVYSSLYECLPCSGTPCRVT